MPTKLSQQLWSLALLAMTLGILASVPGGAAAQPGPYLAVTHSSGRAARYDPVNGSVMQDPGSGGGGNFGRVVASPDGRRLYTVDINSRIRVLNVASLATVGNVTVPHQPLDLAITPDGASVWVACLGTQSVAVIDTATLTVTATIPLGMSAIGIAITPDGQRALVTGDQARMAVIDVATRTVAGSIPMTSTGNRVAVHPSGHRAYVSMRVAQGLSVIDLDSGTEVTTLPFTWEPFGLAVSPDGSTVYLAARPSSATSSGVFVIDTATNTQVATIPGTGRAALDVVFNRDGSLAYVSGLTAPMGLTAALGVIDTATRTIVDDIATGFGAGVGVAFGPPIVRDDCCNVLAGSDDDLTALGFGDYVPI
jgi:YVTN family beta-propeller protein